MTAQQPIVSISFRENASEKCNASRKIVRQIDRVKIMTKVFHQLLINFHVRFNYLKKKYKFGQNLVLFVIILCSVPEDRIKRTTSGIYNGPFIFAIDIFNNKETQPQLTMHEQEKHKLSMLRTTRDSLDRNVIQSRRIIKIKIEGRVKEING